MPELIHSSRFLLHLWYVHSIYDQIQYTPDRLRNEIRWYMLSASARAVESLVAVDSYFGIMLSVRDASPFPKQQLSAHVCINADIMVFWFVFKSVTDRLIELDQTPYSN